MRRKQGWFGRSRFFGSGVVVCAVVTLSAAVSPAQIIINEIDYDQSGAPDCRDFVELCEPAQTGISLTGWQLILYNGQFSQRKPYRIIELSDAPGGVMPANGYLVIGPQETVPNVDIPTESGGWIQNGSPDGMALVYDRVVVELLAYEGTFEGNTDGTGGPAAGMTFPDIGVSEFADDCKGLHKQSGSGAWANIAETLATPGEPCHVGLDTFQAFEECLTGPTTLASQTCAPRDWDCDADVDLADFAVLQVIFTSNPCP